MLRLTLLNLFIVSYFLHFTARYPVLGQLRFDLLLGLLILLLVLMESRRDKWGRTHPVNRRLYWFLGYVFLSLPFVTWPGSVVRFHLLDWLKLVMLFVFIVTTVRTEAQLKLVVTVFLGCQLFRIVEPLYLHVTSGYWGGVAYSHVGGVLSSLDRLSGAPFDIVNANQLAWLVVTVLPFLYYLLWQGGKTAKLMFLLLVPVSLWCLALTGSRSGLICLLVVLVGIVLTGRRKALRLAVLLAVVVPAAVFALGLMRPDLQTRYLSLVESNVAGADTVQGRINGVLNELGSLANNPLFGNGLGNSRETNWNIVGSSSQITHNLYVEILQETGLLGFTLFALYVLAMIRTLRQAGTRLAAPGETAGSWLHRLVLAQLVWLPMHLVYSLSCFGLSSWEWYFFGGVAVVAGSLAAERAPQPVVTETSPVGIEPFAPVPR